MLLKKFLATATSCCLAATSLLSASLFQVQAAEADTIVFDIRGGTAEKGLNELSFTAEELASADVAVPVKIYVPENPGVFSVGLKFQVNDGQVAEDGSFGNYGFTLSDAAISNPYCFDSENEGNSNYCFSASMFNKAAMNLSWIYGTDVYSNADAALEPGTTAWDNPEWAYDSSLAECTLVIPKGTPVGTYVFDVRRDDFILAPAIGSADPTTSCSICTAACSSEDQNPVIVPYDTIPLTINVVEQVETTTVETTTAETTTEETTTEETTTVETTTAETTTEETTTEETTTVETTTVETTTEETTTEETTTVETTTVETTTEETTTEETTTVETTTVETTTEETTTEETTTVETTTVETTTEETTTEPTTTATTPVFTGNAEYKVLDDGSYYWNIADVCGKPGETVELPIYVYGDPGTAGVQAYLDIDSALEFVGVEDGGAYFMSPTVNPNIEPLILTFPTNGGYNAVAEDGACVVVFTFKIPETAEAGTTYPITLAEHDQDGVTPKFRDQDGKDLDVSVFGGSITVLASDDSIALNYTRHSFTEAGQAIDLSLLNAEPELVEWTSSDPTIATVNEQGFVVCQALGSCTITATYREQEYVCTISGGLFGDVDQNSVIDADDATLVLRAYLNMMMSRPSGLTDEQFEIARVNNTLDDAGNPTITADDANSILKYYLGGMMGSQPSWKEITGNPNAPF